MKLTRVFLFVPVLIGGCSQEPIGVRVAHDVPPAPVVAAAVPARSEPVFYNGKTYQVSFAPDAAGSVSIRIAGMNATQAKDALALSHSTFHHFNCKDSQKAVLQNSPTFDGGTWKTVGRCV